MAKPGQLSDVDRDAAIFLSKQLSKVVRYLMERSGETQRSLAPKLGVSRPTLNILLNSTDGKNLWRLPTLAAVARVFNTTVAALFRVTEFEGDEQDDRLAQLEEDILYRFPPGSYERMRWLVHRALSLFVSFSEDPKERELADREDYEQYLRCTPMEIEQGAPDFWKDYVDFKLGNVDIVGKIMTALSYAKLHGGYGKTPLWVAIKETYKPK